MLSRNGSSGDSFPQWENVQNEIANSLINGNKGKFRIKNWELTIR